MVQPIYMMKSLPFMTSYILAKAVLLIVIVACVQTEGKPCHCKNTNDCGPIGNRGSGFEFFGFTRTQEPDEYKQYDWTKLTTAIIMGVNSQTKDFACYAHSKNSRITLLIIPPSNMLGNAASRNRYVAESVRQVVENGLDGINVDYEGGRGGGAYDGLTKLMQKLRAALKKRNSNYTLSQDYVYCASCMWGRTYNFKVIKNYVDYFIIMDYDMQKWYRRGSDGLCVATANSPPWTIRQFMNDFISQGVSPKKLVMALPWYGYLQQCLDYIYANSYCYINCKTLNTGKNQICYKTVMDYYHSYNNTGVRYSKSTGVPYFTFVNDAGKRYQVNYDDPKSLRYKYHVALELHLRGAASWHISCLSFTKEPRRLEEAKSMWSVVPN